jgi:hypothetical protein
MPVDHSIYGRIGTIEFVFFMVHTTTTTITNTTAHTNLNTLLRRINVEVAEITEYDGALVDFDQEEEAAGAIYTALSIDNGIFRFINLIPDKLIDIYQTMLPFMRVVDRSISLL